MKIYELHRSNSMHNISSDADYLDEKRYRLRERWNSVPAILSDAQLQSLKNERQTINSIGELLGDLNNISKNASQVSIYHSCKGLTEDGKSINKNVDPSVDLSSTVHKAENSDVILEMEIEEGNKEVARESTRSNAWGLWTAAIAAAKGVQGGISAFAGRLAQEGVRVGAGEPKTPQEVSDGMLAAGAAINLAVGAMEGIRAGMHTWRALSRPKEYTRAFRGLPPEEAIVGTPCVPASVLRRAMGSIAVGTGVFVAAAHTGIIALTQVGTQSHNKHNFYDAVWKSNGNAAYAYTRELINAVVDGSGIGPRSALLSPKGFAITTGQYLINSLGQRAAQDYLKTGSGPEFDIRWPAISAASSIIDSAVTATAARFSSPREKATFFRGGLSEAVTNDGSPHKWPTIKESAERIVLRGGSRHLAAELASVIPLEIGKPSGNATYTAARWVGSVARSGTHLRDLVWQAEAAAVKASSKPPVATPARPS